jgi:hypothetical protein
MSADVRHPLLPFQLLGFCFCCALCELHLAIPSEFEILALSLRLDKVRKARRHGREEGRHWHYRIVFESAYIVRHAVACA